jgi:AraC family transcriptional regulator
METELPTESTLTLLRSGQGWKVSRVNCCAQIGERPFEEKHDGFTIAAVIEGLFEYHGVSGRSLLHPGALLFGNHDCCFACSHPHASGDVCIALNMTEEFFEEALSSSTQSQALRFPVSKLCPSNSGLPVHVALANFGKLNSSISAEELVIDLVAKTLGHVTESGPNPTYLPASTERRMIEVLANINSASDQDFSLSQLANMADLSRFHFLRLFKQIFGLPPHQYILHSKLRAAASEMTNLKVPISTVVFEAGFNDLSTFNARFKKFMHVSPTGFRKNYRAGLPS